eukprot:gb/GEZN01000598.1/.p1 GENE.gb/GEZN01000598.1/~~gb/GEZN01000598.1/.p1  ORF type:complete len:1111 (+),score=233.75 gb/GEZN01000598.1/:289-3333(+)
MLQDMGFTGKQATEALSRTGFDVERAADLLLNVKVSEAESPAVSPLSPHGVVSFASAVSSVSPAPAAVSSLVRSRSKSSKELVAQPLSGVSGSHKNQQHQPQLEPLSQQGQEQQHPQDAELPFPSAPASGSSSSRLKQTRRTKSSSCSPRLPIGSNMQGSPIGSAPSPASPDLERGRSQPHQLNQRMQSPRDGQPRDGQRSRQSPRDGQEDSHRMRDQSMQDLQGGQRNHQSPRDLQGRQRNHQSPSDPQRAQRHDQSTFENRDLQRTQSLRDVQNGQRSPVEPDGPTLIHRADAVSAEAPDSPDRLLSDPARQPASQEKTRQSSPAASSAAPAPSSTSFPTSSTSSFASPLPPPILTLSSSLPQSAPFPSSAPSSSVHPEEQVTPSWAAPTPYKFSKLTFAVGTFLDIRDEVDKWVGGEIIRREGDRVTIGFVGWGPEWNEEIHIYNERKRFAPFGYFTEKTPGKYASHKQGDRVWAWVNGKMWCEGEVKMVDDQQVQVEYKWEGRAFQRWFHERTGELKTVGEQEEIIKVGPWFKGQAVEVWDTEAKKWEVAEISQFKNNDEACYQFVNFPTRITAPVRLDAQNLIRRLGANIKESEQEKRRKEEEELFKQELKAAQGFEIMECQKDGNCLFRAVGHQIFNDVNKHEDIRQQCYDYVEANKDYFQHFVAEESFDGYIQKRRKLNVWGDDLELTALQEMYNKNLHIYETGKGLTKRPIAAEEGTIPVMRLSYHGGNHYNSVVDPKNPPPLGDGKDCIVSLRDIRKQKEKETKREMAKAQQEASKTKSEPIAKIKAEPGRTEQQMFPEVRKSNGSTRKNSDKKKGGRGQKEMQMQEVSPKRSRNHKTVSVRPDPALFKVYPDDFLVLWDQVVKDQEAMYNHQLSDFVYALAKRLLERALEESEKQGNKQAADTCRKHLEKLKLNDKQPGLEEVVFQCHKEFPKPDNAHTGQGELAGDASMDRARRDSLLPQEEVHAEDVADWEVVKREWEISKERLQHYFDTSLAQQLQRRIGS